MTDPTNPSQEDLIAAWEERMKKRIEEEEAQAAKEAEKLRKEYESRRSQKIKL